MPKEQRRFSRRQILKITVGATAVAAASLVPGGRGETQKPPEKQNTNSPTLKIASFLPTTNVRSDGKPSFRPENRGGAGLATQGPVCLSDFGPSIREMLGGGVQNWALEPLHGDTWIEGVEFKRMIYSPKTDPVRSKI